MNETNDERKVDAGFAFETAARGRAENLACGVVAMGAVRKDTMESSSHRAAA